MQALQLTFEAIHIDLATTQKKVAWFGSPEIGTGFPRTLPMFLPAAYQQQIESAIDAMTAAWSNEGRTIGKRHAAKLRSGSK
jgi:hypothetical protein